MITFKFTNKGKIIICNPDDTLPDYCDSMTILNRGVEFNSIQCDGEPKFFRRKFADMFPTQRLEKVEYHLICGNQELVLTSPLPWSG